MTKRTVLVILLGGWLSVMSASAAQDTPPDYSVHHLDALQKERAESGRAYLPFLNVPELRMGLYELTAGAADRQQPHDDDETYFVVKGRATLEVGRDKVAVEPGAVIYVKAGVTHRFVDITEDLQLLVFFAEE